MAFPPGSIRVRDEWEIDPMNVELPPAMSGRRQLVASLADRWTAILTFRIHRSQVSAWRGWKSARRGMLLTDMLGPLCEWMPTEGTPITFSDGATFSDGSTFFAGATFNASAAIRATQATINAPELASSWAPGQFFMVGERLYQVTDVLAADANVAQISFQPPLRAAVAVGTSISVPPVTPMRLEEDAGSPVPSDGSGWGDYTLKLVEVP